MSLKAFFMNACMVSLVLCPLGHTSDVLKGLFFVNGYKRLLFFCMPFKSHSECPLLKALKQKKECLQALICFYAL